MDRNVGLLAIRASALAATFIAASFGQAAGQEIGDPVIGKRIVEAQCNECHAPGLMPGRPATFEAIGRMPSTTALSLTAYLGRRIPACRTSSSRLRNRTT